MYINVYSLQTVLTGKQIPVAGTGNILRYISRTSLPALYNEGVLEVCAEIDEVMDTVCQLEVKRGRVWVPQVPQWFEGLLWGLEQAHG